MGGITIRHEQTTGKIIKVFYEVYNELGYGFNEKIYEKAMMLALAQAGVEVKGQAGFMVTYQGEALGEFFVDILVEQVVIAELKAASGISDAHEAQLLNYLKASGLEVGLILNFGPQPQIKRLVFDHGHQTVKSTRVLNRQG